MDILELIKSRRSVRKYTTDPISADVIDKLLEAAMWAPSAHNTQPWQFIVINQREILARIPEFHKYTKMMLEAQAAILVCTDPSTLRDPSFWVQDDSAAIENILLAAHGLGLGAVWCGVYPKETLIKNFRELLHIPEPILPMGLVGLGYPADEPPNRPDRFERSRIHYNAW